ncbi:hypothetical protein KAW50_00825 [candidate division WOR-3 bacterium]|nr:hypothetical protein [candidate division WOR-3 bacterium]
MYASGIRQKLPLDFVLGASAYCKDMKNLLTTRTMTTIWRHKLASYTIVEAENEAKVYGVDLALNKKMSNHLSGAIGYSYLNAKGVGVSPEVWFYYHYYGIPPPASEYSLEVDEVHSWNANIHFSLPSVTSFKPISNLNFDLRYTYTTGALFDSTGQKGTFAGKGRMPPTSRVDMRIEKGFKIAGVKLGLFMNVWNVFNYQNVLNVYSGTGEPDNNGNPPKWDETIYTAVYNSREEYYQERYGWDSPREMYRANVENWGKYYNNPGHYDIPRIIQFGLVTHF